MTDAGYDPARLAWLLRDLPVTVCGRLRAGRVFYPPAPPRDPSVAGRRPEAHRGPGQVRGRPGSGRGGRDRPEGGDPAGPAAVTAWHRMHPKLISGTAAAGRPIPRGEELPVVEGTLIRLAAAPAARACGCGPPTRPPARSGRPGSGRPTCAASTSSTPSGSSSSSSAGPRRCCATPPPPTGGPGWSSPAWNQLWLARPLAAAVRLPWQPAVPAAEMTPGRVRAEFRCAREAAGTPASAPKPARPGPGRPKGSKNKRKAPRQPVGKRNRKHPKRTPKTATG